MTLLCQIVAVDPAELQGSCSTCRPGRCFNNSAVVTARSQKLPEVGCRRDEWWKFVEAARSGLKKPDFPIYACLNAYGVCRRSLISLVPMEVLRLWKITGGLNVRTPVEYYSLSAFWTQCVELIESELGKVSHGN